MTSMKKNNNLVYQIISILMIVGIVILVIDVIIPKYTPRTPERIIKEIDFSSSQWIEEYVEKSVGLYGKDFFVNSAFTYNINSSKMILTYASQESLEAAREYYLTLPGAELAGRNDETSLNITLEEEGQSVRIYNYYSSVSRVFELELKLPPELAEQTINQLEQVYPEGAIGEIPELQELIVGEVFGGYVRYRYDQLEEIYQPFSPIYSRAYFFEGAEEDYLELIGLLTEAYPDYRYDETQDAHHYRIMDQIISLGDFSTEAGEYVVSVSYQQIIPQD